MFYLSNVAIGGGLHALIHIFIFTRGLKNSKPHWDLNRGSGGGARGCGLEERVGAHARSGEGSISCSLCCLCVCVLWSVKWRLLIQKKVPAFAAASRGINSAASGKVA